LEVTIKKLFTFIFVSLTLILIISCKESIVENPNEENGGVCLTFDDVYVNEWYGLSELLKNNDIKATFFVTMINTLSSSKLNKLQRLDSLGFEIGCHGINHLNAVEFLETHTLQEYYYTEVLPSLKIMNRINLFPKSYSYPYGMNNDSLDTFMLGHFDVLRDVTDEQRQPLNKEVDEINEIYCKKGESFVVSGLGIDINFKIDESKLRSTLLRASENKEVVTFYAHCPVESNASSYQIEIEYLENLISLIKEYDLKTFIISELIN
jgi:hypothetical protein